MFGFRKRLGSWVLCIGLLCALPVTALAASLADCPGSCTHQAAIGTTHYDTIAEAFAAAADESTVTLLADVSDVSALTIDKAITLDLGGKTITGEATGEDSLITATKDITIKNGTLMKNTGSVLMITDCTVTIDETAVIQSGEEATALRGESVNAKAGAAISGQVVSTGKETAIDMVSSGDHGCELTIKKPAAITAEGDAVKMSGAGKLEVSGGTITAKENAFVLNIADNKTFEAAVTGGTVTVKNGEVFVITTGTNATAPKDFVTGGTFNKIPSDYIPGNHGTQENENGSHTVISSYLVSFQSGGAYGTMDPITVPCGESITLPQCGFTPGDYMEFAGWDIGGTTYAVGASFTPTGNTLITALWSAHEHYGGYATCISPAVCSGCGNTYGGYGSHDLSSYGGYAATCDSTGMLSHVQCVHCGICFVDGEEVSSFSLAIPALGHQWKDEKAKAATCTQDGVQEHRRCTTCGTIQIAGKDADEAELTIPALGHTLKTIDAVQSTCTQAGVKAHSLCTTCNKRFLQNQEVTLAQLTTELASHVLGSQWITDDIYHWKTCADCGDVFRQEKHTDANGDNLCDDCGYAIAVSSQPVEADTAEEEKKESEGFPFFFLIPIIVAVVIAVSVAVYAAVQEHQRRQRRKKRQMPKIQK